MGRAIDFEEARGLLAKAFSEAEDDFREGKQLKMPDIVASATERLFLSKTQAYREALVGCALARLTDSQIDIRYPVAEHSDNAFSGRTLDQQVVNPFFVDRGVPVSKNPYLSSLRRGVLFVSGGAKGQRDSDAFDALVVLVDHLRGAKSDRVYDYLQYLLGGFIRLREASDIQLRKVARLSLDQYSELVDGLLQKPSGGLMPVLLAVAMFETIKDCFGLDWQIEYQGINVADAASGAGGDITVRREGEIAIVVEVTERPIPRERVVATFNAKIAPSGLDDYLFFYSAAPPTGEALDAARKYFAQGHDINFVAVRDWIITAMTTIGPKCRAMFTAHCLKLLATKGVPAAVKQTWNEQVTAVIG